MQRIYGAFALLGVALLVSACGGGGKGGRRTPVDPPPPPSQAGSLQFQASGFAVDENAGTATLTITRTGGSDGAVSVAVASSNGSATATEDYTSVSTTVSFAAGEAAAKTVTVPIADDSAGEADETLSLTLSAPSGGASLGATATATLTIRDNDPLTAPALTVGSSLKQLTFNWASIPGATSYRLLRNPDGASGFTQVGADHAATATSATLDVAVHRHDWVNALYQLEACNARGCSASTAISAVDAMLQAIGYFKASNTGQQDLFGFSLALSADGSTLAVGALFEGSNARGVNGDQIDDSALSAGAVYVFTRSGMQWSQQAYLKASNTQRADVFGFSLALSADGNTLAVGAIGEDSNATTVGGDENDNNASGAGAVYMFTRTGAQWSQQAYLKASNAGMGDSFGNSLALSADGNTLAVGAQVEDSGTEGVGGDQTDNSALDAGAVYVFTRAGAQWSHQAYVKASSTSADDNFGRSLAMSADGNTLAVGATGESSDATGVNGDDANDNALSAGAVYVFTRNATLWSQQAYVKASNTTVEDLFGLSLAMSADGNTLAVGAIFEDSDALGADGDQDDNSALNAGAVYLFARSGVQWSQQSYLKPSNTDAGDNFGRSLALSADGNTLAVGANGEDSSATAIGGDQNDNDAASAGAVYVLARIGTTWSHHAYVKASNTDVGDELGSTVALSADGTTLAVGASKEASTSTGVGGEQSDNSAVQAGAVYVF